ncbi:hypothetical protein Hanom_Chr12g01091601 [Helianthus anomalus]
MLCYVMLRYLWNMQTSAINCSLLLNTDKSEKSPDNCILLAASAISTNSFLIALCQCNISSIGQPRGEFEELITDSLFLGREDEHAQFPSAIGEQLYPTSSSIFFRFLIALAPSIQVNIIFN